MVCQTTSEVVKSPSTEPGMSFTESRSMPDVTVILLNYKRPDNTPVIVDALRCQTEPPEIWVIDNAYNNTQKSIRFVEVDRYMWLPWNGGCFARLLLAAYVQTPYVCFLSDDLCPTDDEFMADLLETTCEMFSRGAMLVGTDGHGLNTELPYYEKYDNQDDWVPLLKGTCICFLRALLDGVHLSRPMLRREPEYMKRCDDLYLSLEVGAGKPIHWADASLRARLRELPGAEVGLCKDPAHYRIRDNFCRDYMKEYL